MNEKTVTTEIHPVVNGVRWHLFTAGYETADGHFSLHFHAVSLEHAAAVVEEIKATLTLKGQLIGTEKA